MANVIEAVQSQVENDRGLSIFDEGTAVRFVVRGPMGFLSNRENARA